MMFSHELFIGNFQLYGARSLLARTKSLKFSFYAPNFEEVEEHTGLGLSVCVCMHLLRLRTVMNR